MAAIDITTDANGVEALRALAKACPTAGNAIVESAQKLKKAFDSYEEELGPHSDEMREIIISMAIFIENAKEPLETVSARLNKTADALETYIASGSIGGSN